MALIPQPDGLVEIIDKAIENKLGEPPRPHLGASQIGNSCERALWYSFHWAIDKNTFNGRMLRLFKRGQLEEANFIEILTTAGIECKDTDTKGKQFSFSEPYCGGHFGGAIDGLGLGIPQAPKTWHLLEFKTHSDKSFKELCAKGLADSKPLHFAQMQIYMHWSKLERGLYCAVNKNDDALYFQRISYNKDYSELLIKKARRVIKADSPPAKLSDSPTWYECKFCDFYSLCHGAKDERTGALGAEALPAVNCRTCLHSTAELEPDAEGKPRWSCAKWACDIPVEGQRTGCNKHRYIPALIPWAAVIDSTGDVPGTIEDVIYEVNGESHQPFINGEPDSIYPLPKVPLFSSAELKAINPALIGDENVQMMRDDMDAQLVEVEGKPAQGRFFEEFL